MNSLSEKISPHARVFLTGVTSIHGWYLYQALVDILGTDHVCALRPPKPCKPDGPRIYSGCITNRNLLNQIRQNHAPTHVVHCGGVCDLDVCEERPAWARALNTTGARQIFDVFGGRAHILFFSTDLAFSGNKPPPGGYCEADCPDPVSVAGRTFVEAEEACASLENVCCVRLGLPIGRSTNGEAGAIDFIESRLRRGLTLTLFHDEWRSCIRCETIVGSALRLMSDEVTGLFHLGGDRGWSLFEVGRQVLERGGYPEHLLNTISRLEEKNGPPRIGNVALNSGKIKRLLGVEAFEPAFL